MHWDISGWRQMNWSFLGKPPKRTEHWFHFKCFPRLESFKQDWLNSWWKISCWLRRFVGQQFHCREKCFTEACYWICRKLGVFPFLHKLGHLTLRKKSSFKAPSAIMHQSLWNMQHEKEFWSGGEWLEVFLLGGGNHKTKLGLCSSPVWANWFRKRGGLSVRIVSRSSNQLATVGLLVSCDVMNTSVLRTTCASSFCNLLFSEVLITSCLTATLPPPSFVLITFLIVKHFPCLRVPFRFVFSSLSPLQDWQIFCAVLWIPRPFLLVADYLSLIRKKLVSQNKNPKVGRTCSNYFHKGCPSPAKTNTFCRMRTLFRVSFGLSASCCKINANQFRLFLWSYVFM